MNVFMKITFVTSH